MIHHQRSPGPVLALTCLIAACGGDCDCKNLESRIAEIDSEIIALKAPHAANHQFGGTDPINVTGLYGVLTEPQPPAVHDHNTFYYTKTEIDARLNGKTNQIDFATLDATVSTLTEVETIDKSAMFASTFEYRFATGNSGSPFALTIPADAGFNPNEYTIVPIISISLDGFSSVVRPQFYYSYTVSDSQINVQVYNADGNEVVADAVDIMGWNDVIMRVDVIWTAMDL